MAVLWFRCTVEDAVARLRREAQAIEVKLDCTGLSRHARENLERRLRKIPKLIYAVTAGKFAHYR